MLDETLASRHTLAAARCAMVAKRVLMAATLTQVNCGRERQAKTAEQQNHSLSPSHPHHGR